MVARTVSNYGGEITVKNRPEGGAEFLINLPIAREPSTGNSFAGETKTSESSSNKGVAHE